MTSYSPEEVTRLIAPEAWSPEIGLLFATRAQAAATLRVSEVLEEILYEIQSRR